MVFEFFRYDQRNINFKNFAHVSTTVRVEPQTCLTPSKHKDLMAEESCGEQAIASPAHLTILTPSSATTAMTSPDGLEEQW